MTTIYDAAITASDPFFGPQAALAEFDSVLSASVNAHNNDRVFNNAIVGGATQELVQDLVSVDAGWRQRTQTGAVLELNSITGYDNNNRVGNSFPNYWETQLETGIRQPLMRGAGRNFNRIAGPNARPGFNFSNDITSQFGIPMSDSNELALVMTTVESADHADELARSLVDQSLAACVQIDGPIISHYRWAGKVERANEFRLLIKTSQKAWPRLKEQLAELHPYDEPEIIMLPIADVTDGYRDWVLDQTE